MADYIYPSETTSSLADTAGRIAGVFGAFRDRLDEADRISQYSSGLAAMDRAFSQYNRQLKDKRWARPRKSGEVPGTVDPSEATAGAEAQLTIGQIEEKALADDHAAMVKAQRDFILQNTSHKTAQEQLLQALEQRSVQNYDQVANLWGTYKTHQLIHDSDANINYYAQKSTMPPEQKMEAIRAQLQADVSSGLRLADDAAIYEQKMADQINSSWAVATAIEMAKMAKWDTTVSDVWLDANTPFWEFDLGKREAAKTFVRREADYQRGETLRLDTEYDDKAERAVQEQYHDSIEDLDSLRKIRETLPQAKFRDGARLERWTDKLTSRIQQLESQDSRDGPDLDKQDDRAHMMEYLEIRAALDQQRPLNFQPQYGDPTSMRTLGPGKIPSPDDVRSYLMANFGAAVGKDGVANPRLRTSFVESEYKDIGGQTVPALRDAISTIWAFTKPMKDRPIPTINNEQAGRLVSALRTGYEQGRFKEEELSAIAAQWATNKAVEKAVTDNIPLNQQLGGGVRVMDTTERYINDAANHWYNEWRDRDDAGELGTMFDQHAKLIATRVQEYVGSQPSSYAVQNDGSVWVWYANPSEPGNVRRGTLYRFQPQVVDQKTNQYADPAPKLQVFNEGALDWETPADQRPYPERAAEARNKTAAAAQAEVSKEIRTQDRAQALAAETARQQRVAELHLEDWQHGLNGKGWYYSATMTPATPEQAAILDQKEREAKATGAAGARRPETSAQAIERLKRSGIIR